MINAAAQCEKTLETPSDVVLYLLRWHARKKRGYDHDRDFYRGKQIHGHPHEAGKADDANHQARDDDEVGITNGKTRHMESVPRAIGTSVPLAGLSQNLAQSLAREIS